MPSLDLLSVGDATKDVFVAIDEATVNCAINSKACQLCLNYADKIPVSGVVQVPAAGNAANAAVGSARLGHTSGLLTILGDDSEGRDLTAALRKDGVDHRYVTIDKKHGTNYSTVLNFKGERTILVYHQPRTYVFPTRLPKTRWVYYTSIGKKHERYEKGMLAWLAKHPETKMTFNPGTHQLRRGLASLRPAIKRSHVFIVNKEEAEYLMDDGVQTVTKLMVFFKQLGPSIIIITDGSKGSWAYDGKDMWRLPMFPGEAIERTGAGDSYGTGVTNALLDGKTLAEAMCWGTANARSVVLQIGPQAGLLTGSGMKAALKKFAKIKPVKVTTGTA